MQGELEVQIWMCLQADSPPRHQLFLSSTQFSSESEVLCIIHRLLFQPILACVKLCGQPSVCAKRSSVIIMNSSYSWCLKASLCIICGFQMFPWMQVWSFIAHVSTETRRAGTASFIGWSPHWAHPQWSGLLNFSLDKWIPSCILCHCRESNPEQHPPWDAGGCYSEYIAFKDR